MSALLGLLSPRVWAAVALAIALAGTHWRAYTSGKRTVQTQWTADTALRTAAALVAEQSERAKEQANNLKNRKIANDYAAEKTRRVAADVLAADSLRQLTAALAAGHQASTDTAAPAGADDDPRDGIIAECASALVEVDAAARRVASQVVALQSYAASVCMSAAP